MTERCPSEIHSFLVPYVSAHKMDTVGSVFSREKIISSWCCYSEIVCADAVEVQVMGTGTHVLPNSGTQPLAISQ